MAKFFQKWIQENFSISYEIQCDEMITEPRSILQKLDSHTYWMIIVNVEKKFIISI